MTGPVDPVRPFERRQARRRAEDGARGPAPDGGTNLPAVIESPPPGDRHADHPDLADPSPTRGFTAFAAHVYGQSGQKRGLRGGQPVIDRARAAYLETEYSGPEDRRPAKGLLKKTEI
ncbi:MAG: hypothetical protein Q8L66_05795 [Caulobacter sp.]|nr:hypothetical protein [Caulobacter sp.]